MYSKTTKSPGRNIILNFQFVNSILNPKLLFSIRDLHFQFVIISTFFATSIFKSLTSIWEPNFFFHGTSILRDACIFIAQRHEHVNSCSCYRDRTEVKTDWMKYGFIGINCSFNSYIAHFVLFSKNLLYSATIFAKWIIQQRDNNSYLF